MYAPSEDSFLLAEILKIYLKKKNKSKSLKILDMGTGTGILAETCISLGFKNILASDIDREALDYIRKKKIKAVKSDLFSKIKGKFDLIIFNPPYLPADRYDRKKDTTGGKCGDETILRFLKQAKSHLEEQGAILLLLSSLTPRSKVNKIIKKYYKIKKLAEKKFFFEKLEVWRLRLQDACVPSLL